MASPAYAPRVAVIGGYRSPLGLPGDGLTQALAAAEVDIVHIDARQPLLDALRAFRRAARAVRQDGVEMVHLMDARFAPVGVMLRRRYGVPVSVTVSTRDVASRTPLARLAMGALNDLDQGFVAAESAARALRVEASRLLVSVTPLAASVLPWPSRKRVAALARTLRGVRPGRLVLGVPWPENRNDLRWFRDVVLPQLDARPLCLLLGAPSRRQVRLLIGATGMQAEFRAYGGRIDADTIAAAARCVDAFVIADGRGGEAAAPSDLALAMAVGGVPVVTHGSEQVRVLAHERNSFLVEPGDEHGFVRTLNDLLALPAIQRHFLGEDFARFTLSEWPWEDVADVYADRFAALAGRPRIPAELRAA
jgi:hypothetical protein